MYIDASSLGDYEHWAKLYKDDKDNYFLYGREGAGRTEPYKLTAVTDKNILTINLNQDDIVVLDIFDFYGDVHSDDEYIPEEITVKDYYEKSPTTITKNLIDNCERTSYIDNANMSKSNNHNVGLDIKDGKIFVFADYVGP